MRRNGTWWIVGISLPVAALCLTICSLTVSAQQTPQQEKKPEPRLRYPWETSPIYGQYPAMPPAPAEPVSAEAPAPAAAAVAATPVPATAPVPVYVLLPSGTVLNVVLETPLSSRIARKDQKVTFRTTSLTRLSDGLELPPDMAIQGTVVEAQKPGGFGRAGSIRVRIDHLEISRNARVPVVARLQSAETDKRGSIRADNRRGTDLLELAQYTLGGTLLGSRIGGGKGAAVGAGAGALAALIIMMSHRGPDVYLEPGMPFAVVLDQSVELPGQEVLDAQRSYAAARVASSGGSNDGSVDPNMTIPPNERPVLKRRPKKP